MKDQKRTICAAATISAIVALIALASIPAIAASTQADYAYALEPQNWEVVGDTPESTQMSLADIKTITISGKGFAFQRISEDTIRQYNSTMELVVQVQPAAENGRREVDVTGTITVNGTAYTISDGQAFLGREKKAFYINCTGTDEGGNEVTLKLGGHYFWWGGNAYALRMKAVLQTDDGPMLLLQRGIARIS